MTHSFPTRRSSDLVKMIRGCRYRFSLQFVGYAGIIIQTVDGMADIPAHRRDGIAGVGNLDMKDFRGAGADFLTEGRSEEHTSELQSLMRISYAVFCLKKKKKEIETQRTTIP